MRGGWLTQVSCIIGGLLLSGAFGNPFNPLNPFEDLWNDEGLELRVHEGTVDEHGRRLSSLGSEPKGQVLIQIHGGNRCDGPPQNQFVVSVGLCLVTYKYIKYSNGDRDYGYANPDNMKPNSSFAFDFEEVKSTKADGTTKTEKSLVVRRWTKPDGSTSFACDEDGMTAEPAQPFYTYLYTYSPNLIDSSYYKTNRKSVTKVGSCQSLVAKWDSSSMSNSLYTSVKATLTGQEVNMGNTALLRAVSGSFVSLASGNTCGKPVAKANYFRFDFGYCYPAEKYHSITPATVGSVGGNPLLHSSTQVGSWKYTCANGRFFRKTYSDNSCQEEVNSNQHVSTCSVDSWAYGRANHEVGHSGHSGYKFREYGCRVSPESTYPSRYEVGTKLVAKKHNWAFAKYYTGENCEGDIYAVDSNKAGLLHQCLPAERSSSLRISVRSYTIVCPELCHYENSSDPSCKGKYQGFKKYYYNNMECFGDPIADYPYPYDAFASRNSDLVNNGSCVATSRESYPRYLELQAKSYRYVCSYEPPEKLGVSAKVYSQEGCKGFVYKAMSFRPDLGSNWTAPSQSIDANPNTAPYHLKTTCEDGKLVNTWYAVHPGRVTYDVSKNVKYTGCMHDSIDSLWHSHTMDTSLSGPLPVRMVTSLQCDNDASESKSSLSPAEVVGIVLGTTVFVFMALAAIYWAFMYGPLQHLLAKDAPESGDSLGGSPGDSPGDIGATETRQPNHGTSPGSEVPTQSRQSSAYSLATKDEDGRFEMGNPMHESGGGGGDAATSVSAESNADDDLAASQL